MEDIGQAVIQYIIFTESDSNPTTKMVVTLSICSTIFSLLFGLAEVLVEGYQPTPHMASRLAEVNNSLSKYRLYYNEVVDPRVNLTYLNRTISTNFRQVFDGSSCTDVIIEEFQKEKVQTEKDNAPRTRSRSSSANVKTKYFVQFYFATHRDTIVEHSNETFR